MTAWGAPVEPPAVIGIAIDFILFALTLAGIALFHRHTLTIAVTGLAVISLFKIAVSPFAEGPRPRRLAFAPRSRMGAAYEPARPAARFRTAVKALRD
jgi:hypothetical protein